MKILFDTSFIAALRLKNDSNHDRAKELLVSLSEYKYRKFIITDYILDEVLTLLWVRSKFKSLVQSTYAKLTDGRFIDEIIYLAKEDIDKSWGQWNKYAEYPKKPLSFTDATILTTVDEYDISLTASFDQEFGGLIPLLA